MKVVAGVGCKLAGWLIRPLARASKEARGPGGLRSTAKKKQAGFVAPAKNENVGSAGGCASVGSVVECRGGPGPMLARWLRLGSAGRASCWPHRCFSIPGMLTSAFMGRAPARGFSPRFRIWRRLGPRASLGFAPLLCFLPHSGTGGGGNMEGNLYAPPAPDACR